MIKRLESFLMFIVIIGLIHGCTTNDNTQQHNNDISSGAVINSVRINNAWNAPTTLLETTSSEPYGGRDISLVSHADNGFFASWGMPAKQTQFAMRSSIGVPWAIAGPDITDFTTVYSSKLYSNPESTSIFATWNSPDHGLGTHYISRYTPDMGWTKPLAFADVKANLWSYASYASKVIVGANAEAVLFWQSYAENGTVELHARRFDSNGKLSLVNTLIVGQPGQLSAGVHQLNGWINAAGNVELYWVGVERLSSESEIPILAIQLWQSTYTPAGIGLGAWSVPEKITNARFEQSNFLRQLDVIPKGNDNVLVVFRWLGLDPSSIPRSIEYKSGAWGELTSVTPTPIASVYLSNVAHNAQGQTVFVWVDRGVSSTPEFRVFATQHSASRGWTPPVQISGLSQPSVMGGGASMGDEPKVSINAAGQIAVTWIHFSEQPRNLYTNYYDPATGWQGETLAVTTTLSMNELLGFNIALSDSGDVSLMWQEAEVSADGNTTVRVRSADHVGVGNGVANVVKPQRIESTSTATNGLGLRTRRITPNRIIQAPLTPQQRISSILAAANPRPIISSAWDEPRVIDVVTSPNSNNLYTDLLHLIANDQGDATVYLLANTTNDTLSAYLWGGDVLSGGWDSEFPLSSVADPSRVFIGDMKVDGVGDLYLAGEVACPDGSCADLYVTRKPIGGTWEAPVLIGENIKSGVELIVNSTSIGAVWAASRDASYNPELAYAQYHRDSGWSAPDLFSPAVQPNAIGPLSHGDLTWYAPVLSENGIVSMVVPEVMDNTRLVQRHPVDGWMQAKIPAQSPGDIFSLSTTNDIYDTVHVMVTQGYNSSEMNELSYLFANGGWSGPYDVVVSKKGEIRADMKSNFYKPMDRNSEGKVLFAWNEQITSGFSVIRQVRVNRYNPSVGWGEPIDIGLELAAGLDRSLPRTRIYDVIESLRVSINESGQGAVAWADISGVQQALNIVHLDASMTTINHEVVKMLDLNQASFDAIDLHLDNQGRAILVWDELSTGPTEVTHRIMTTTHHPAGAISPSPVLPPETPSPVLSGLPKLSPNWRDAEIAWAFPNSIDLMDLTPLPVITAIGDNPTLAIQVDRQFDWVSHRFTSSDHTLVSSSSQGVWNEQTPFGNVTPSVMTGVQVASDANSQTVFALWSSQQQLYINHQIVNGAWGAPQRIADNAETGYLLANTQGQTVVVWQPIDDLATVLVSEVSVNASGAIALTTGDPSTRAASIVSSDPVFNNQGTVALLRSVATGTGQEYVVTQYQVGSGWRAWPDQVLNTNDFYLPSLQLAITSDNEIMAFAQSESLRTLHSALLQTDGTWTHWIAMQSNGDAPVGLTGKYRIGSSTSGHLYVMWVEEIIDNNGEPITNVMFSSFDRAGLTTGAPWQSPTLITQIRHPHYHETPQFLVSRDGAAAIIWEQTTLMEIDGKTTEVNTILVKKYRPGVGWNSDPEIAAAFPLLFRKQSTYVNTQLSDTGTLFIAWRTFGNSFSKIPPTISMTRGQL